MERPVGRQTMRFVGLLSAGLALACSGAETGPVAKQVHRQARGPVVATVDGDPITLSEIEELVQATELSPREALARLENERVLAAYAEGRGYGKAADAELKRARVRALLASAVEVGNAPSEISSEEVSARFEAVRAREEKPETRSVMHVLFKIESAADEAKAAAGAQALLRELQAAGSADQVVAILTKLPEKGAHAGVQIVRETGEATRAGTLQKPFVDSVFAASAPGVLPATVRTTLGLHVIFLKAIKPAVGMSLADSEQGIRRQLSTEKRSEALAQLIEQLKVKDPVVLDEAFVRKALADDSLLGTPP